MNIIKNEYRLNKKHIALYVITLFLGLIFLAGLFFTNDNKVISLFTSLGGGLFTSSILAFFIERINKKITIDDIKKKRKMAIQDTIINLDLLMIHLLNKSVAYCKEVGEVFDDISEKSIKNCIYLYINKKASELLNNFESEHADQYFFTMMKMFEERGTKKILKPDEIKLLGAMDVLTSEESEELRKIFYIIDEMEDKLQNEREFELVLNIGSFIESYLNLKKMFKSDFEMLDILINYEMLVTDELDNLKIKKTD